MGTEQRRTLPARSRSERPTSRVPSIFETCTPRPEVLAGELPDSIFAADLWDVVCRKPGTHPDYLDPNRFFAGTHPTVVHHGFLDNLGGPLRPRPEQGL